MEYEYILECENVCKSFKGFRLADITFSLEPGYILGLIGENGAGKSTLLQLILGGYRMDAAETVARRKESNPLLTRQATGEIIVAGNSMRFQPNLAKEELAYVLNTCPFSMVMTAKENAKMYGTCYKKWNQLTFEQYCNEYQVPMDKPLRKLSKGQQILFQLAFALSYDAKLYVMDEPAGNLDVNYHQIFLDKMQELVEDGTRSVIYVTHQLEDLEQIGDYILWLHKGKQLYYDDKESLLGRYTIISASEKELRYIKQMMPGMPMIENIQEHVSEAMIRGTVKELPLNVPRRTPTLEELMFYYSLYEKDKGLAVFDEEEEWESKM